jgi:hypothetical protein
MYSILCNSSTYTYSVALREHLVNVISRRVLIASLEELLYSYTFEGQREMLSLCLPSSQKEIFVKKRCSLRQ